MPKAKATKRSTGAGKKEKDPNAPKRALSAYMYFAADHRESVRQDNPSATFGDVGKILGARWKALSPEDREPYEEKARDDKKRYEAEKKAYAEKPKQTDAGAVDDEDDVLED